ncbi:MAG: DNA helicase II [Gammaproteobacteria bacterium]|nr:MAG: DNA helicase II [Gammaproteobacteria bacterium]
MDVSAILDGLNDAQREAVSAANHSLLVLAGAGSGKTRVLVHRIAWLIQVEKMTPSSIMAVTFTNKAAREMRGRIETLLGIHTRGLWFGTFHSIAHRLLRAHWREAKLPENFQIIDSEDQLRLVKRLSKALDLEETKWPAKQTQSFINSTKDKGIRAQHSLNGDDLYDKVMTRIYTEYETYCQRGGLADFGELLLRGHELLLHNATLLDHYQRRFRHILVDEFQDTNTIQYAWLRVLAGERIPVTVVGDDDQSIYGWRGAKIENIQQFQNDFDHTRIVRLEQNYRSTQTILNAANGVIAQNPDRLGKHLWADGKKGDAIDLYAAFNEQDEANYVSERIKDFVDTDGSAYAEIAILYRSNAQSRMIEESLLRHGLPYRVYGGLRFYDRAEIKNALAYLRLVQYRHDDAALERVINVPPRGIGNKTLEKIRSRAQKSGCSMWQAATDMTTAGALTARAKNAVAEFLELIESLARGNESMTLSELMKKVLTGSRLLEFHGNEKGERAQTKVENLKELVNATRDFEPEEEDTPLAAFIAQTALDSGDTQADQHQDSIQLMTLHSAKGLEFPRVFMVGMEEGLFPHDLSAEEPGRLAEERRLCYVGMTRAMEKLILCYAESRRLWGQDRYHSPSRFVREIPPECMTEVRLKGSVSVPVNHSSSSLFSQMEQNDHGFRLGQRVLHAKFGEGVIMNCEGQGQHARVQVNFADGMKWLVLSYANLQLV